jgi:hypothetical protein
MPTNTDLVTDLPADFEVFGQAVATSMADLLGGTTGQVLSKTTNADMDFTWINNDQGDITGVTAGVGITGGGTSGTVTVTNDMATTITTAGDLIYGTGSGTYTRRAIGSTGNVLTVSGGVPTWAAPAGGGGKVLQVVNAVYSTSTTITSSSYQDTGLTATITPSSASSKVLVFVNLAGYTERSVGECAGGCQILRGATVIVDPGTNPADIGSAASGAASTAAIGRYSQSYLDSPATTSATTYKVQAKPLTTANSSNFRAQPDSTRSTITLMEIGA